MLMRSIFAIACFVAAIETTAVAQQTAPPHPAATSRETAAPSSAPTPHLWSDQFPAVAPVPNGYREYPGTHGIGEALLEQASNYRRTAYLASDYSVAFGTDQVVSLAAGTPFVAVVFLRIAVDPPVGHADRVADPASSTDWCALTDDGSTHCFY